MFIYETVCLTSNKFSCDLRHLFEAASRLENADLLAICWTGSTSLPTGFMLHRSASWQYCREAAQEVWPPEKVALYMRTLLNCSSCEKGGIVLVVLSQMPLVLDRAAGHITGPHPREICGTVQRPLFTSNVDWSMKWDTITLPDPDDTWKQTTNWL